MDINDPRFVRGVLKPYVISEIESWFRTNKPMPKIAVVDSVGAGHVMAYYPSETVTFTVINPNEIPCEVGDHIYITEIGGTKKVDCRKTIQLSNIYVDYDTGVDSYADNGGHPYGTEERPFKTLQYAINRLPKNLNGRNITIYYEALNPLEVLNIDGYHGGGFIKIQPKSGTSIKNIISASFSGCVGCSIDIQYLGFTKTDGSCIQVYRSNTIAISHCRISESSSHDGIQVFDGATCVIRNTVIENRRIGILLSTGMVASINNSGHNTEYGLMAQYAGVIGKSGTQLTGTLADEVATAGGEIR